MSPLHHLYPVLVYLVLCGPSLSYVYDALVFGAILDPCSAH